MGLLTSMIERGHVSFHESAPSWREAIKASYAPLLKDNTVEETYVEAVVSCVDTYGPYIVIMPDIAMPHTTLTAQGCHGNAIAFMKVEQEVDFEPGDPDKKARVFFSLASCNSEQHLSNIQQLMDMLMNEEILDLLKSATSIEDLKFIAKQFNI